VDRRLDGTLDLANLALLVAMGLVNALIGALAGQRRLARGAEGHAAREARLRRWGETLRDAAEPAAHAGGVVEFFRLPDNAVVDVGVRAAEAARTPSRARR